MRVFESSTKNYLYLGYRLMSPLIDPIRFFQGIWGYIWFLRDLIRYKLENPHETFSLINFFPILHEKISVTPFDSHYFYQEIWAFRHILSRKPKKHIDIASKYQFAGFLSTIVPTVFIDIRPIQTYWKNLSVIKGDVLHLPYKDKSIRSLSSLHVIEHIGLGRYGDPIDPEGTKKACKELSRVLAVGGKLYVSIPTGRYRMCFNAHRIHPPDLFISYFPNLKLVEFSVVDDAGKFHTNVDYRNFLHLNYGCGMFLFTRVK